MVKKILASDKSAVSILKDLETGDYNTLICMGLPDLNEQQKALEIVQINHYRIAGSFLTYAYNRNVLNKFLKNHQSFFRINTFSIESAVLKQVFWNNNKIGWFKAAIQSTLDKDSVLIDETSYFKDSFLKSFAKFLRYYFSINFKRKSTKRIQRNTLPDTIQFAFVINDVFEWNLYKNLILKFDKHSVLICHYGQIEASEFSGFDDINLLNINELKIDSKIQFVNVFKVDKEQLAIVNAMAQHWGKYSLEVELASYLKASSLKTIFLNEAENLPFRNIMKPIVGEDKVVFNSMNGLKAGEAQDSDITFDKWFVWSESMKNKISNSNHIPLEKFIVSGHPSKDSTKDFEFKNLLNIDAETLINKRIVAFFSIRGNSKEKFDAIEKVKTYLENNEDVFLIFKPHPLETDYNFSNLGINSSQYMTVGSQYANNKQLVFEILYMSDLTLVFGSTVAIESTWFKVPCMNIEYREQAIVEEQEGIFNIKNIGELMPFLLNLKKKSMTEKEISLSVFDKMYQSIKEVAV